MEDRWLSVAEIPAYLGIKTQTLYKWLHRGTKSGYQMQTAIDTGQRYKA
jgi:excisionase family DNA binding protein